MPNPYPPSGHDPRDQRDPRDPRDQRGAPEPERRKVRKDELKIPIGQYPIMAIAIEWGEGDKSEQIGIACEIIEGPHQGEVRTWYGSFSDAALEFTMRGMIALGFNGGTDIYDTKTMLKGHGGKVARATIEHDEWEGSWREKIAWINGDGVVMKKKLEGANAKRFQDRMRGVLARMGSGPSTGSAPPSGYGQGQSQSGYGAPPQTRNAPPQQQQRGFGDNNGRPPPQDEPDDPWSDSRQGRPR